MRCVLKLLLEMDALDDPAARKAFREVSEALLESVGEKYAVRELKLIEDRTGRLIDKKELSKEEGQ